MSETNTAHKIDKKPRTLDVKIQEKVDFDSLLLSDEVLTGLKKCGFERPSPIQLKAIPLGRCGLDLIVQAKSGTGKTCVFAVIALENIVLDTTNTQILILAPTREIAVQIWEVINSIGSALPKLRCYTFIGGMPVAEDKVKLKKCHIAVGTPGRVKQLIEEQALNTEAIRLFVLDEADKLMEQGFQETINWIYSSLAENKQMLALSATYPEILAKHLTDYMRNPTFVRLNTSDPSLLGIRQYYKTVPFSPIQQKAFELKSKALLEFLNAISFQQCLVFSNYQLRAQSLSDILNKEGWPATYISGSQVQQDRLVAMAKLKTFKCRVLISTDLTSRGIDAENVDLVVNLDIPHEYETYLHRIGRAGRFGTYGAAVTFAALGKEMADLKSIQTKAHTTIHPMPDPVPADLTRSSGYVDYSDLITAESLGAAGGYTPSLDTVPLTGDENSQVDSAALVKNTQNGKGGTKNSQGTAKSAAPITSNGQAVGSVDNTVNTEDIQNQSTMNGYTDSKPQTRSSYGDSNITNQEPNPNSHNEPQKQEESLQSKSGIDELFNEFQLKLQSEFRNIEHFLEVAEDSTEISKQQPAVNECSGPGINGTNIIKKNTNSTENPVELKSPGDVKKGKTENSKVIATSSIQNSPVKNVNNDKMTSLLPTVESLQRFAKNIRTRPIEQSGLVLPKLSDIVQIQRQPVLSYDDILADLHQFQETGKSNEQHRQVPAAMESNVYLETLLKVEELISNLQRGEDDLETGDLLDITGVTSDSSAEASHQDVAIQQSKNNSKPRDSDEYGPQIISSEAVPHRNSHTVQQVINEAICSPVAKASVAVDNVAQYEHPETQQHKVDYFKDMPSNITIPEQDKIIGFCELNAHIGHANPMRPPVDTDTKPSVHIRTEKAAKNKTTVHRSSEDSRLGRDAMRKLTAQIQSDSDSSGSSYDESDTETDEYSWSSNEVRSDDGHNTEGDDYDGYYEFSGTQNKKESAADYKKEPAADYLSADWEPVRQEKSQHNTLDQYGEAQYGESQYSEPQPQYSEPQYSEQQYGQYEFDYNQGQGEYYNQGNWDNQAYPGYSYGHGCHGEGSYGPGMFPHQLWMQCHQLLSSINASQAAQYSWYCQQQYYYHMQYARIYEKLSRKDKTRSSGSCKSHKQKQNVHKAKTSSANETKM